MAKQDERYIDFATFTEECPLSHPEVVELLMIKHYNDHSGKRREKVKNNLTAIFDATFKLSNQMGFSKMSMRDLNKECGMSLGGLYIYFESKDAIALMITNALHEIAFGWLPKIIDQKAAKSIQLEQLIRGHIYLSELLRPWFSFVFMNIKTLSAENKERAREVEALYQRNFETLYNAPSLPCSHIMCLMQDWHVKHWKYRDTPIDEFADSVLSIALNLLEPPCSKD